MTAVRLGAVSHFNTCPLVYGLEQSPRFDLYGAGDLGRAVPQMLELATARAEGDTTVAQRAGEVPHTEPHRKDHQIAGWEDCRITGREVGSTCCNSALLQFCRPR